jgi:hypothetical protein
MTNSAQYKALDKYYGKYPYNGSVVKTKDGTYQLSPNKVSIDDMLQIFQSYVEFVLNNDGETTNSYITYSKEATSNYYNTTNFYKELDNDSNTDIDYENLVYASGKVNLGDSKASDLLNKDSTSYKVLSAVNELQYAYTTDTSVLSEYIGYTVSAYTTSYIKEFEYAAQQAIRNGAGSFTVCAGDYGWHLMYVTYTFDFNGGVVYSDIDWSRVDTEGTFENLFYESIKSSDLTNAETNRQSVLLQLFYNDTNITKYTARYQDLLDLDNE